MRRTDWVARLWREAEACARSPFKYGEHDCWLFAARCVDAMTGSRLVEISHDFYASRRAALRIIAEEGSMDLVVSIALGDMCPGPGRRGDVCSIDLEEGLGVGVNFGAAILAPDDIGLASLPLTAAHGHWRIA
jgi:hypothetical protein